MAADWEGPDARYLEGARVSAGGNPLHLLAGISLSNTARLNHNGRGSRAHDGSEVVARTRSGAHDTGAGARRRAGSGTYPDAAWGCAGRPPAWPNKDVSHHAISWQGRRRPHVRCPRTTTSQSTRDPV